MADLKKLSPLEALEAKHAADSAARRAAIEAATRDVREAEAMVREGRGKVAALQHENLTASFAYDAERARLEAELRGAKAA